MRLSAAQARKLLVKPKARHKYRAKPVTTKEGQHFDSTHEYKRWLVLKDMERCGEITDLVCQPRYPLVVNEVLVGTYEGDFSHQRKGALVLEDAKGLRLPIYRLKAKLMRALYGIIVTEV